MRKSFVKYGILHQLEDRYFVDDSKFVLGKRCGCGLYVLKGDQGKVLGYNVVYFRFGTVIGSDKPKVIPPPSSKWGVEGWSYYVRESAVKKFEVLKKLL